MHLVTSGWQIPLFNYLGGWHVSDKDPGNDRLSRVELSQFEKDLARIPGVRAARVIGEEAPSEIHIVASVDKPAKQIVRDVQSLAAAAYDITIDHRIVSVVQSDPADTIRLDEPTPEPQFVPPVGTSRVVLNWLMIAPQGDSDRINVGIRWDATESEGGAVATTANREARARAAAEALAQAIGQGLTGRHSGVEIDSVVVHKIGNSDSVTVKANYREEGIVTAVIGTALINDDVASATAKALLQALNRKLERAATV